MKKYLKKKWKTRQGHIVSLLFLLLVALVSFLKDPHLPSGGALGFWSGFVASLIMWFGPVVYVEIKQIKIRRPRPTFVEPSQWVMIPMLLVGWLIAGALFIVALAILDTVMDVDSQIEAETFAANTFMAFGIFSAGLSPIAVYMIWIRTRYNRVVEYGTPEWRKARDKKSP